MEIPCIRFIVGYVNYRWPRWFYFYNYTNCLCFCVTQAYAFIMTRNKIWRRIECFTCSVMFWHARVVSICLSMENSFKYELLWTKTLTDARVLIYTILSIYCLYIYMLIVSSIMWYLCFQLLRILSVSIGAKSTCVSSCSCGLLCERVMLA